MARIRESDDAAALLVTAGDSKRNLGSNTARRIGQQQLVIEIAGNENLADKGLDEVPFGDTPAIAGLDYAIVAQIIDESAADLQVVVTKTLAAAGGMEIDVTLAALVEKFRATRFIEHDGRCAHMILHDGLETIENVRAIGWATNKWCVRAR